MKPSNVWPSPSPSPSSPSLISLPERTHISTSDAYLRVQIFYPSGSFSKVSHYRGPPVDADSHSAAGVAPQYDPFLIEQRIVFGGYLVALLAEKVFVSASIWGNKKTSLHVPGRPFQLKLGLDYSRPKSQSPRSK